MPGNDQFDPPAGGPGADEDGTPPSRRSILASAAGATAAGVAATVMSGFGRPATSESARTADRGRVVADSAADADAAKHVVAHVRDARTGEIDVFGGTSEVRLHDPDLAARIIRASRDASGPSSVR